ncbi:MAG: hypothetical protein ACREU2_03020 [Steroidobacteraceae bacterium]
MNIAVPEQYRIRVQRTVFDWKQEHERDPDALLTTHGLMQGNAPDGRPVFHGVPEQVLPLLTQAGIPFELV